MTTWKQQLKKYNSLLEQIVERKGKKEGELRFNRCTIRASDVAGQYYCEKKIEMEYLYGEVETETKNQGTEAHENLLEGSEKVCREDLWKAIYSKEPVLALEWLLLAEYKDIILTGQPDSVLFENGFPLVIFEYKFSRSKRAYPSYHVQAGFYGLLLKSLGFDTEKLFYAIVVADRRAREDPNLKDDVFEAVMKNGLKKKRDVEMKGGVIIIGSLLWDTKEVRNIWRENSLDLKQACRVYLPIRYGRKSRSRYHTCTMVFSTKCYLKAYGLGIGWIVPIRSEIDSFEDLKEEARRMGETEGFQNGFSSGWGSVALKLNPEKTIDSNIIKKWSNFMSGMLTDHQLLSNKLKTERSAIDSNGFLTIRWPQKIEAKTNHDVLDFLISTSTVIRCKKKQ